MIDLSVLFVCWSNTCRSPMARVVGQTMAERENLRGVRFTSAGVSAAQAGNGMDLRAVDALQAAGYRTGPHSAHRVTPEEIRAATMVIGMQPIQLRKIREMVPGRPSLSTCSPTSTATQCPARRSRIPSTGTTPASR